MKNTAREVLGQERIEEICEQYGLGNEDLQLVDRILETEAWDEPGDFHKEMQVIRAAGDHPNFGQIYDALAQIREELAFVSK